jgi:magnesium chelatase family protein
MSPPPAPSGRAVITSAALTATGAHPVRVHASVDFRAFRLALSLVGLGPDDDHTARDRIRAGIINSGVRWPQAEVALNLLPFPLAEPDPGLDLAVALALLTATGDLPSGYLDQVGCCGELGLDGSVRPVPGLEQRIQALIRAGFPRLIVPDDPALPDLDRGQPAIWATSSLREIIGRLQAADAPAAPIPGLGELPDSRLRRLLVIAAAGGQHLAVVGCPDPWASQIGQVLAGLLPDLDDQAAREVGDLHWQAGRPRASRTRTRPPWVGALPPLTAGTLTRPGPASLAHHGVYCPADPHTLTDQQIRLLRSVLDQRRILVRDTQRARSWPARTQLALATRDAAPATRLGPVVDRIDLHLNLGGPPHLTGSEPATASSAAVVEQITRARMAAARRWSPNTPEHPILNAEVTPNALQRTLHLLPGAYLRRAADTARLSARGWIGVLRLAWTIADLNDHDRPTRAEIDEAVTWRTGEASKP